MTVTCMGCGGATLQRTDCYGDKEHNCTNCGLITYAAKPDNVSTEDMA